MGNNEICVSAGALATDAEGGGSVAPGVGDEVDFTGKAKVARVEGENVYLTPTEVNGQPVMGAESPEQPTSDDPTLDEEVAAMNGGGGGAMPGMLLAFILAIFGLTEFAPAAYAQKAPEWARARDCSGGAVSNYVATAVPTQAYSAEINNFSGATLYCLVFDSATNQLNGAVPHFAAVAVPTASTGGKDWGAAGAPFRYGVNVCLSTTPFSLTNASSGGTATVIHSPKQ